MTELTEYEQQLATALRELASAEHQAQAAAARLAAAQRHADALNQVVGGLRVLEEVAREPHREQLPVDDGETAILTLSPSGDEDQPRGREAIRRVMSEMARDWRQADLVAEIRRRGWIDPNSKQPDAAIRVAVRRLAESGELEKVPGALGVYRLKDSGVKTLEAATREADESEASIRGEEV